jgi:LacI family transcriptional regulator
MFDSQKNLVFVGKTIINNLLPRKRFQHIIINVIVRQLMRNNNKPTIQDIALHANVSISTVSRVLTKNAIVAEDKRMAVQKAMLELNYKPNRFAQGLAGGLSRTIGILTQEINNPLYNNILKGILEVLDQTLYSPILADGHWNAKKEEQALHTFLDRSVDGLIVLGGIIPVDALIKIAGDTPLIVIGRDISNHQHISLNDFEGAYKATSYLIEMGHNRIVHITGLMYHMDSVDRREGYLKALTDAGITPDPDLIVIGDYAEASGLLAVEMLLMRGRPFSAIFAANDQMAYGARLGLYRRGIRVPDDISIVGYDNQTPSAYTIPPLTTVFPPSMDIGMAAGRGILDLMEGKPVSLPVFSPILTIRESVARVSRR